MSFEMKPVWDYVERTCLEQGIDDSHGLKHAKSCVERLRLLMEDEHDLTNEEVKMAYYAVALHDMCDKKYTDVPLALEKLRRWLLEQDWSLSNTFVLLDIVNSMSYSKLKKAALEKGSIVYPDHGAWNRVYHLVRHADLLDAYLVGRCLLYTKHSLPEVSDDTAWHIVEDLFENRIFKYVSDGWIFLPAALALVPKLEAEARECFRNRNSVY
jgi:hypothetical protein